MVRLVFQVAPSDFRGISGVRSEDNGRSVKRSSGSLGDRWQGPEIKPCALGWEGRACRETCILELKSELGDGCAW